MRLGRHSRDNVQFRKGLLCQLGLKASRDMRLPEAIRKVPLGSFAAYDGSNHLGQDAKVTTWQLHISQSTPRREHP